jgi:hypothetical protein
MTVKKKLYLNGKQEWPSTIELMTDVVEERHPKPTTVGGKPVYAPEEVTEQRYEYVLCQSIGDTDLNDLYEAAERFSLRVAYVNETKAKGQAKITEFKEYVLQELLPTRIVTNTAESKVYLTVATMTPPSRKQKIKPEVAAG